MARGIVTDLGRLVAGLLVAAVAPAAAQTQGEPTRGALLYATHCVACHDTQMHWRDKRAVRDWDSLVAQVRLWQGTQLLQWSEADIHEVARHLNDSIYRLPPPGVRQGRVTRSPPPG